MKNTFSLVTSVVLFLAFAIDNTQANQVKRSKSNISNNRAAASDTGLINPNDEPLQMDVKTPRDAASGQASGKRMHQPSAILKSVDTSAAPSTGVSSQGNAAVSGAATTTIPPAGSGTQPASKFNYPILPAIKSTLVTMPETDPTLELKK